MHVKALQWKRQYATEFGPHLDPAYPAWWLQQLLPSLLYDPFVGEKTIRNKKFFDRKSSFAIKFRLIKFMFQGSW